MVIRAKRHREARNHLGAQAFHARDETVAADLAAGCCLAQAFGEDAGGQKAFHAGVVGLHLVARLFDGVQKLAGDLARGLVGRRHHLRHHHTGAILAQLVGQCLRAHKRHVVERAAETCLAGGTHKGGAGAVGGDLHHRIGLGGHQLFHGGSHVHRIALHRGSACQGQLVLGQRLVHAVKPGLAIGIVLVEHGDLLDAQVDQLAHDERGFVVVRSPHMEDEAIERLAQRLGPRERGEKRHLGLVEQGHSRQAGGCAHIAKQCKHVVSDELAGVFCAAVGLVAVVQRADFHHALAHATGGVELVKKQLGPLVELDTQLRGRA